MIRASKVTESDIKFMMESDLSDKRASKMLGLSQPTVSKYRKENDYIRPDKTVIPDEDIKTIMESDLSGVNLSKEIDYCQSVISNIRTKYGYKLEHRGVYRNGVDRKPKQRPELIKPKTINFFNMRLI